ncbi:hypothetical protein GSI_10772 [Ganoderma sinense ZZ0214-1]|uniref:Mob1/phocein n=1 Tax=Ganoderma sinense ZZ0214-1 TaxID=1077348 RepID=A0A2G8S1G8_9APHY|nr:hypothetical protein GSI_10772 [Ganoderma sinense ZZ0214-1]
MAVAIQRPLKGSRISSFYPVKSLPPLSALDSAFQLQEYISLLIRLDVHDVERIVSIPGKSTGDNQDGESKAEDKDAEKDGNGSVGVDEACWVYEQLRRLAQDLSHPLITMLQLECTRSTCPEMKAGEWLYLCVAHGNEGAMEQCCAIDYILHTLDSATALLNSPRAFPSRLSVPHSSHRHFSSLARRLGRIFAHAYFHHREAFEQAEAESSLYARFLALTSKFELVPAEFLVIPPRLTAMGEDGRPDHVEPPRLLGAALDPHRNLSSGPEDVGTWNPSEEHVRAGLDERGTNTSPAPPAQRRNESPRKFGRNRTDTMVYSEAFSVAEELAKGELSEVDIDREIAAERAAAAVEADVPTSAVLVSPASTTPPTPPPQELEPEEEPKPEEEDEEEHEEPKEESDSAHTEEPSEVPEPEVKHDEAEESSLHEETSQAGHAESLETAEESHTVPEEISAYHDEAADEKADADAVESSLLESHEEPAPKTEESTSAPSSASDAPAPAAQEGSTEEASKGEDEEEEDDDEEDGEDEEEGSDEEEESSDDESDVSSTVLGVVHDEPVVAVPIEKKEAKPDVPEEAESEEAAASSTEGEKVGES